MAGVPDITGLSHDTETVEVAPSRSPVTKSKYTILLFIMNLLELAVDLILPLVAIFDSQSFSDTIGSWADQLNAKLDYSWTVLVLPPLVVKILFHIVAQFRKHPCIPLPIIGYSLVTILTGMVWGAGFGCLVTQAPALFGDIISCAYYVICPDEWVPDALNVRKLHQAFYKSDPMPLMLAASAFPMETVLACLFQFNLTRLAYTSLFLRQVKLYMQVAVGSTLNDASSMSGVDLYLKLLLLFFIILSTTLPVAVLWYMFENRTGNTQESGRRGQPRFTDTHASACCPTPSSTLPVVTEARSSTQHLTLPMNHEASTSTSPSVTTRV